jgi:hypothetical protein
LVDHVARKAEDERTWTNPWTLVPEYEDWLSFFRNDPSSLLQKHFYNLDPQKYGRIFEHRKLIDLRNGGFFSVNSKELVRQKRNDIRLYYQDFIMGLQENVHRDSFVSLTKTEIIERALTAEEMEEHNPILKDKKKKRTKEEEENLIRSIKVQKVHEDRVFVPEEHANVWLSFDNDTRVFVEKERVVRREFLEEEQFDVTCPIAQVYGIQSTAYKEAAVTSVAIQNGNVVKILPGLDILMQNEGRLPNEEEYRLITGDGTVIRYLRDNQREVLMANGNTMLFDGVGNWTTTNNKGLRKRINIVSKEQEELTRIPAVMKSNAALLRFPMVCFREDGVKITLYQNEDRLCNFKDGTAIFSSKKEGTITIESPGHPTLKHYSPSNSRVDHGALQAVLERAVEQKVYQIFFPEGSNGFVFVNSSNNETELLLESSTGTLCRTNSTGEGVIIPGECRWSLSKNRSMRELYSTKKELTNNTVQRIIGELRDMREAMTNGSKMGKGKKLTKKQQREEVEREEKRFKDYENEKKGELLAKLDLIDSEHPQIGFDQDSVAYEQIFLAPTEQNETGVFFFDINESMMSLSRNH